MAGHAARDGREALERGSGRVAIGGRRDRARRAAGSPASLADHGHPAWLGLLVGAAVRARSAWPRARRCSPACAARLDAEAASALPLYGEGAALVAAGLSILVPPLSLLSSPASSWLLLGSRRREGEKYAGLRILR